MDVAARPLAPAELRRFAQRFGPAALLDSSSRAYRSGGLAYMRLDEDEIVDRLLAEPALIRLPLVRSGKQLAVGSDEAGWAACLAERA